MSEAILREAARLISEGRPLALATVVRTQGSTPQKPGARLLVRDDGSIAGTLGGGCVEAWVVDEARRRLRVGEGAGVQEFELSDDLALHTGMVCGGTMEVLIEPVRPGDPFAARLADLAAAYRGAGLAVATRLSPPAGLKLFIDADGRRAGGLEDAGLEEAVAAAAFEVLARGTVRVVAAADGAEAFMEGHCPPPSMVLVGAGHISRALAPLAHSVGFRVTVIDDRPSFANPERFPMAERIVVDDFEPALRQVPLTPSTAVVIATRGHKHDDEALRAAALSPAGYVGLVGSRRKVLLIYEDLLAHGVPFERLRAIHAPVGLDIGARTPEEIAVSIIAEVLMVRSGASGRPLRVDERLLEKARARAATAS